MANGMNISLFKIFRDLVENRSFSRAAELNSITQSAVSQQVANLEKRLKCRLVERRGRELELTPEGHRFFQGACKVLEVYDHLMHDLQHRTAEVTGPLRISTVYSIGLHELPPLVKRFMKEFPKVEMHVEYRRANQVYDDVLRKQAALGFVAFPHQKAGIEVRPFRRDRLVLVCHPHHPLASHRTIPMAELANHKLVGFDADIPTREALERIFKKHRLHLAPVMDFDNIETLKRAVEMEMGISIVPFSTVEQEIANHTLRVVEFADEELFRPLGIVLQRKKSLNAAAEAFLKMAEAEASK
jgi:DNA-binding transcriptional LysR family regulator